ncbi:metalloregulator ArsR/SmtB family transcription factor [Deferribacterales bacterium Es71-Z0220]|jgi:ArsR family transcriptional regulator|uniref:ArsR/SmtB family transcription factor n=1 Tax=Deferrivibrio essentukiensis TaxID=2880922 RepID=UPI001F600139|nr:metalloregulator ArsR/SmtB family transcription factor [Deferrivibrio essentukiensis]MBZ4671891.1 regulatory protein ArsR [Deferribacteraceae bacterium]MCB4203810.1 metalloregulator ArsR/SmtB family transcription factor [Deferrivibrio essentukiensis]
MHNLKEVSKVLKSLSEENRLRITIMLLKRDLCVCEINEVLHIALSTISAHLKNLKYTGVIEDSKDGRWVVYKLTENKHVREIVNFLYEKVKDDKIIKEDLEKVDKIDRYSCSI